MALKNQAWILLLAGQLLASSAHAQIERRASCPTGPNSPDYREESLEDMMIFMDENRIYNVSGSKMKMQDLNNFLFEYSKFPESLREEMVENFSSIHLITGNAVTDDKSWGDAKQTFDSRQWSTVVGAGGYPYKMNEDREFYNKELAHIKAMKNYCKNKKCASDWENVKPVPVVNKHPTRIVINKLYTDQTKLDRSHGSVNLFLHEHAHSLDSLYEVQGVSNSDQWKELFSLPETSAYMDVVCLKPEYCKDNRNEGFAELFAYYHACEASQEHMARNLPVVADYFANLKRIKEKQTYAEAAITGDETLEAPKAPKKKMKFKIKIPKIPFPKLD